MVTVVLSGQCRTGTLAWTGNRGLTGWLIRPSRTSIPIQITITVTITVTIKVNKSFLSLDIFFLDKNFDSITSLKVVGAPAITSLRMHPTNKRVLVISAF